jgi:hypothetical protein
MIQYSVVCMRAAQIWYSIYSLCYVFHRRFPEGLQALVFMYVRLCYMYAIRFTLLAMQAAAAAQSCTAASGSVSVTPGAIYLVLPTAAV